MSVVDSLVTKLKKYPTIDRNLGYGLELSTYLRLPRVFGTVPKSKFVIFGTGRSGSTLLVSLLKNQHSIGCDNEIFHRRVWFPERYLNSRSLLTGREVYGFKLLTYQLNRLRQNNGIEFLPYLNNHGYKIIYLTRDNVLRQAISNLYARERKQFHQNKSESKPLKKVTLDLESLDNWVSGLLRQRQNEASLLENLEYLELNYEKDLLHAEAHQHTLSRLSELLNAPISVPKTKMAKIVPNELSSIVANYEELLQYARSKNIEHFI